jgi:YidC/Oxa1 family membrane protein insertase
MDIFNSLISPFVQLIEQIFLFAYSLTGDYGVSIVFLSFVISLLLLPVFILIERVKRKDDAVKQKMKPLVEEIKRCYKGQERYYYLRTVNRQYNYSPARALIPTLSLLLQIPFFIAAYQFLEHYGPLKGVGFLFIKNLAAPDALIGFINILPIAMTLVNLITAYFYTRNGNTSERRQMLVIAAIFLVLLYRLPSGLVLYWTMNNVFSFFRLFITNPYVFKKQSAVKKGQRFALATVKPLVVPILPKLKRTFIIVSIIILLGQFNWAFNNSFNQIGLRIIVSVGAAFLITLFLFGLTLIHNVGEEINTIGLKAYFIKYNRVFRPLFIVITSLVVMSQLNWAFTFHYFNDITLRLLVAIIGSGLVTILMVLLILYYKGFLTPKTTKFQFKLSYFKPEYFVVFSLLSAVLVYSQINWALLNSSFKTIVPRLSAAIILSWCLTLLTANMIRAIQRDQKLNTKELIRFLLAEQKKFLILFLIAVLIAELFLISYNLQHNLNNNWWQLIFALAAGTVVTVLTGIFTWLSKMFNWTFAWMNENPQPFFSLLFLGLYFHLASLYYYTGFNFQLSSVAYFFIVLALAHGYINFKIKRIHLKNRIWYSMIIVTLLVFTMQLFNMLILFNNDEIRLNIFCFIGTHSQNPLVSFINYGIILAIILSFFYDLKQRKKEKQNLNSSWGLYILAIFYLAGFIFLWNPLAIYSSYPDNFEFPAIEIIKSNLKLFAIVVSSSLLLYLFLPKKYKPIWLLIVLILTCIGFIHNTLLPIDMGTLQENKFVKQNNMAQPVFIYFLEALSILGVLYFLQRIQKKKYFKPLGIGLLLLNLVLISQSLIASATTGSFMLKPKVFDHSSTISFSRTKENIVYLLTDMFHGWYMNRIINENPELKDVFEGFVWYPNTISVSYTTAGSIPALLTGYENTIDKLNQDKERTFEDKMTDISFDFYNKIKSKNYRFISTKIIYSKIDNNLFDTYIPSWSENWDQWNSELNIGISKEVGFTILWENAAFYTAPLFIKPIIYNKGKWFHGEVTTNENTNAAKPYNFLRLLPYISHNNSDEANFMFFYSLASHHPWDIVDEQGILHNFDTPYENNKWVILTLAKWIKWMKENKVYDNTKIIIFSDHGPHWVNYSREIAGNMPVKHDADLNIPEKRYMGMYPLLLTKDFNRKGRLRTDNRFMSNVDAYYFAFNEENPIKMNPSDERELPFSIVYWERDLWLKNTVNVSAIGTVKANVFDLNNWKLTE